jgi:hypothetical protein
MRTYMIFLVAFVSGGHWVNAQFVFQNEVPRLISSSGNIADRPVEGGLILGGWGPSPSDPNDLDLMLARLTDAGDTLWMRRYASEFDEYCHSVTATSDGGILVVGTRFLDNEPGPNPYCMLAIKTDGAGDTLWCRTFSRSYSYDGLQGIECLAGGYLLVGYAWNEGMYFIRLTSEGEIQWTRRYNRYDPPNFFGQFNSRSLTEASDGSFISVGGNSIAKFSPQGELEWVRSAVSDRQIEFVQVRRTSDQGFAVVGHYGIMDDILLMKLAPDGGLEWTNGYATQLGDFPYSVVQASDGGYMIMGASRFNGASDQDVLFLRTDAQGYLDNSLVFGVDGSDGGRIAFESEPGHYILISWISSLMQGSGTLVTGVDSSFGLGCIPPSLVASQIEVTLSLVEDIMSVRSSSTSEAAVSFEISHGLTMAPLCPVGLDEEGSDEEAPIVYPNPAGSSFSISIPDLSGVGLLQVFNSSGLEILGSRMEQRRIELDCAKWPSGIYVVRVTLKDQVRQAKVAVE